MENKIRAPFRSIGLGIVAGALIVTVLGLVVWYQANEMDLVLNKSGAWDVQIVIDDPRAYGKASFRVDVSN
jgi:hypothetical protein